MTSFFIQGIKRAENRQSPALLGYDLIGNHVDGRQQPQPINRRPLGMKASATSADNLQRGRWSLESRRSGDSLVSFGLVLFQKVRIQSLPFEGEKFRKPPESFRIPKSLMQ